VFKPAFTSVIALATVLLPHVASATSVTQTNLVSDIPGLAANTDPDLKNAWGISFGPATPFWVSANGSGVSNLYTATGTKLGLVVAIPGVGGAPGLPTGQVFDGSGAFNGDRFIFAGEDGVISGWRPALGTSAEVLGGDSNGGAVYKGLAIGASGGFTYLYAADFHNNRIDVMPSTGAPALAGNFVDPNLPAGYAPFNVQNIDGQIYVSYAKQDAAAHDDAPGAGFGFVSIFSPNGDFVKRLASGGALNAPWGLTHAPVGWGDFGGDILVGNFGDGTINAFDMNGKMVGTLLGTDQKPLTNDGLWALTFGNGSNVNSLYLTAGLNDEANGLLARVDPVPEPATFLLFGAGALALAALRRRRPRRYSLTSAASTAKLSA
jgi:uncharacterized protein (TIGR03118 family)